MHLHAYYTLILIKIEKNVIFVYCYYRDIIKYRDNFFDNNRDILSYISPNPIQGHTRTHACGVSLIEGILQ